MKDKIIAFAKSPIGLAIAGVVTGAVIGFFVKKDKKTSWLYVGIGGAVMGVAGFITGKMLNKKTEGQ